MSKDGSVAINNKQIGKSKFAVVWLCVKGKDMEIKTTSDMGILYFLTMDVKGLMEK